MEAKDTIGYALDSTRDDAFMQGHKAGIREVVEWIESHGGSLDGVRTEWQAKLKEWNIKEG